MKKKVISVPRQFLLFLVALLIAIYVNALLRLDDVSHLGMSALFFLAVGKLFFQKYEGMKLETTKLSAISGFLLLAGIVGQAVLQNNSDVFWRMMPFLSAVSLVFLVSAFKIFQFWKECIILFFLGAPKIIVSALYDPSALTAKSAAYTLWYLGFDSRVVKDIYVILPTGGIKVFEACSGLETVCYTLALAVVLMLLYPVSGRFFQWSIPVVAIAIGFTVNLIRVVILALLNAWQYKDAFVFWHERDGSLIFGMIAVLILGAYHYFLPQNTELEN